MLQRLPAQTDTEDKSDYAIKSHITYKQSGNKKKKKTEINKENPFFYFSHKNKQKIRSKKIPKNIFSYILILFF